LTETETILVNAFEYKNTF